jgi:DNA-binding transcriptional MerR regulator/methylmalonyl-CoA mutase cobalamin-binding subunit
MTDQEADSSAKRHPIEVVARRTGLSKDLLRAWERRHAAVDPARTDTGRRLYSDDDVERLRLLRQATAGGRNIGSIAGLPEGELSSLVREDLAAGNPSSEPEVDAKALEDRVVDCIDAIEAFDGERLRSILSRAMVQLSPTEFIDDLVAPLMRRMGELWVARQLNPGQEHLASSVVAATLQDVIGILHNPCPEAPEVIVATPAGQKHGIGAMLVAASAAAVGWRVTYLGADLPAEDIAEAARTRGAAAVALSVIYPPDDPDLPGEIVRIWNELPSDVEMVVGGASAPSYSQTIRAIGASLALDLEDLRSFLHRQASA